MSCWTPAVLIGLCQARCMSFGLSVCVSADVMCVPSMRCTPEQFMQMNRPRLKEAHVGSMTHKESMKAGSVRLRVN